MIRKFLSLFRESTNHFEGKQEGEVVILLLRRHRFVVLFPLSFIALFALVPPLVWSGLSPALYAKGLVTPFLFIVSIWYLILWVVTFYCLLMWSLNTVVVTDRRIIENEQHSLFNRKVSELHAYRVQDVSTHTNGVIETFLHFGDIVVQTAASEKQFIFHRVPNPESVKDTIMQVASAHQSKVKLA